MVASPRLRSLPRRLGAALRTRLRVDARSLAAFRVALGLLVVADLLLRTRDLTAFYTDAGVLPRTALLSHSEALHPSLHALLGGAWFQALLFALAGIAAAALVVGYRTRTATVLSWVFLVSLHNRNTLVLNGGDFLLRMLLFWAMFLPLAERWSIDRMRSGERRGHVLSVASVALLVQVLLVYSVNAAFKLSGSLWLRGEALEYALGLGQFTVLLGDVLGSYPLVLSVLDYAWLVLVVAAPLLLVLTGFRRVGFVALLASMHLGMALTMRLGLFPLISVASLLPFLPGGFWDAVRPRLSSSRPVSAIRESHRRLEAVLPVVSVANVPAWVGRWRARLNAVVPLCFLVLVVLWNLQYAGFGTAVGHDVVPEQTEPVVELTRIDQYWNMFAPDPLAVDGWYVVPGTLANGSRVDAFRGGSVEWERPRDVSATYPNERWRKYLVNLWRHNPTYRDEFAGYLCRRWNRNHETALTNLTVYFVKQPTRIQGTEPTERVELEKHRC